MVTIKIKDVEYTLEEAREIYNELKVLFDKPSFSPFDFPVHPNKDKIMKDFTPLDDSGWKSPFHYKVTC